MRRFARVIGVLIGILTMFGSMAYAQEGIEAPVQAESMDEKATIVFFRTGRGGGAIKFHVHNMEGTPMGYLGKSGDNFSIEVEPGSHQFWSRTTIRNDVLLNVESGKTYYVKATVKIGVGVGRPVLEEVPESAAPNSVK